MPSPTLPTIESDSYERTGRWTETVLDLPVVTVRAHNAVYENPDFLDRVRTAIPADLDRSPRALFTTGLSVSRAPPGDPAADRVFEIAARYARREFRTSIADQGLCEVADAGERSLRLSGRRRARAFGYDADYPLSADAAGTSTLAVRVWAAIWPTDESFAMAGGIYPRESATLSGPDSSVEAAPNDDRRRVFDAIRAAAE